MNNSDSEELLKRREMAAQQADQIEILRNAVESNKRTKGLVHLETLESMITLADALGKHSPNWLEERNTLSDTNRKQREEELEKERTYLYGFLSDNSTDMPLKIKASIKLASILPSQSDAADLFRSAIKDSSNYYGAYSERTLECIEEFLRSEHYDASDLDTIYQYHNYLRDTNGYSRFDGYSFISEFCVSVGNLEFALSLKLDALEYRMQGEPLWFIYENASNYDDLCELYIKLKEPVKALDLLDSLIESYNSIESLKRFSERGDILESLQNLKKQIASLLNQNNQSSVDNDLIELIKKTYSEHLVWEL